MKGTKYPCRGPGSRLDAMAIKDHAEMVSGTDAWTMCLPLWKKSRERALSSLGLASNVFKADTAAKELLNLLQDIYSYLLRLLLQQTKA